MSWTNHYENPIRIVMTQINNDIRDNILEVGQKYSIDINEEQLVQLLKQDRTRYDEAYKKGFREGVAQFQDSVARLHMNILDMMTPPEESSTPDLDRTIESIEEWINDDYADDYPLGLMQDALDLLKTMRERKET